MTVRSLRQLRCVYIGGKDYKKQGGFQVDRVALRPRKDRNPAAPLNKGMVFDAVPLVFGYKGKKMWDKSQIL